MRRRNYEIFAPIDAEKNYRHRNVKYGETITTEIEIDYPLTRKAIKRITFSTLYELIDEIRRCYREIYYEEERTMTVYKPSPEWLLNRGESNGIYGIRGHEIGDLWLELLTITEDKKVYMYIGS